MEFQEFISTTLFTALTILILLIAIVALISALRNGRKEKTILSHIQVLRRSIGAAFILGFIIMCYSQSHTKNSDDYNYAGLLLLFISAIHYGYARKAEKAAIALEASK
jgi:Na+-transporting NADH:ubiquinone oxidoreductase subunit NqrD